MLLKFLTVAALVVSSADARRAHRHHACGDAEAVPPQPTAQWTQRVVTQQPNQQPNQTPKPILNSTQPPNDPSDNSTQSPSPSNNATQVPSPTNNATQVPSPSINATQVPSPSINATQVPSPSINATQPPIDPGNNATQVPSPTNNATQPTPSPTSTPTPEDHANFPPDWQFTPVKRIHVRVQGNLPVWDKEHQVYITSFGNNFEDRYNAVVDTVNMASVEGMFKYVQAECINKPAIQNCQRKSNVKYIVFYETVVVQPAPAIRKYMNGSADVMEHCPYLAMDGGQCNPVNGVIPKECEEFAGTNGSQKLGFCVGGQLFDNDILAPYPNTYWYSFPNSCPTKRWSDKTSQCRKEQAGGLCPHGVQPDGIKCTFSFKILGWLNLDDVVGITSMVNPLTNQTYKDYSEFCKAGGIEYQATALDNVLSLVKSIPFWSNPSSRTANAARVQHAVDLYTKQVAANAGTPDGGKMLPLPSITELQQANPPCYKNTLRCRTNACRRNLYSQTCELCFPGSSSDCISPPH